MAQLMHCEHSISDDTLRKLGEDVVASFKASIELEGCPAAGEASGLVIGKLPASLGMETRVLAYATQDSIDINKMCHHVYLFTTCNRLIMLISDKMCF